MMKEERVVVTLAAVCSLVAIGACIVVLPSLYSEISHVHDEVGCRAASS